MRKLSEKISDLFIFFSLYLQQYIHCCVLFVCFLGTIDPTPFLYDSTMYTMGGLMVLGGVLNSRVKPLPNY